MSDNIYHKKTRNWVKGVLALNKTREALCECIYHKLDKFINVDLSKQKNHLEQFFICLGKHDIQQLKQLKLPNQKKKNMKLKISCEHELCSNLMKNFVNIHGDNQKLRDSYQWMTVSSQSVSPSPERDQSKTGRYKETKRIWQITALYMYVDKGDKVHEYRCLDGLDISKIVKMMTSCTIFVPDGSIQLYDAVRDLRNALMHSPHNHMEDDKVIEVIQVSKQLLDCLHISDTTFYKLAIQELQKLEDNDLYIGYGSFETKDILEKVVNAKDIAATLDKVIDDWNTECKAKSKQLFDLLEKICQTGMQPMVYKPKQYKQVVETYMEEQVKAIDNDMASLDKQSSRYNSLKWIRDSIENKRKELLRESETDERLAFEDSLEKSSEQFKGESAKTETEEVLHKSKIEEQATCNKDTTKQLTTDSGNTENQVRTLGTTFKETELQNNKEIYQTAAEASGKTAVNESHDETGALQKEKRKVKETGNLQINSSTNTDFSDENLEDINLPRNYNETKYQEQKYQSSQNISGTVVQSSNSSIKEGYKNYEAGDSEEEKKTDRKIGNLQTYSPTASDSNETIVDDQYPKQIISSTVTDFPQEKIDDIKLQRNDDQQSFSHDETGALQTEKRKVKGTGNLQINSSTYTDFSDENLEDINLPRNYNETKYQEQKYPISQNINDAVEQSSNSSIKKNYEAGDSEEENKTDRKIGNLQTFSPTASDSNENIVDDQYPKQIISSTVADFPKEQNDDIKLPRNDDQQSFIYTDKLMKDAVDTKKTKRGDTRRHESDSDTSEVYLLFERGIYSMKHRCDFSINGQSFRSVQQYLMFKKAELFNDFEKAEEILSSVDPKFLQQKGREVKGFKEDLWKSLRFQIAKAGTMAKFSNDENLCRQIMLTHPKQFVMASPNDEIWGIGLAEQDPKSRDKNKWNGKNEYGNVLTEVRNSLLR